MLAVARAQKLVAEVVKLESAEQFEAAEKKLCRLLPDLVGLVRSAFM